MQNPAPEYYSIQQAAQMLRVHWNTVYLWIKKGRLTPEHWTPSGRKLFTREQLIRIKKP